METKRVTEDFGDRSIMPMWTPPDIAYIMKEIEKIFEECDEELVKAEMAPLGYEKQPIDTMTEHAAILISYVFDAYPQCSMELDHPLYVGFKNGATETLSNIVLEDITTENTFGMQEYVELCDVEGTFYQAEIKPKLSMKDFFTEEAVPVGRAPVIGNVETVGWFTALFRADYEAMAGAVESPEELFEFYLHGGEYGHKEYHPIGNFISGILDVTIIKPLIESIWGQDLITGEKLTDFERGMQLINAVVGALTLGQGAMALNFAEMTGRQVVTGLLKTWAVDAVADMSAYTVGCVCDELGLPAGITFIAGLMTGCTVSVKAGKYVFEDAGGKIVKELDADGMWEYVGGGKKDGTDTVAYHSVGGENSAKKIQSVLDGIDISYTSPESRFGQGFYVAADGNTTIAELVYHGTEARYSIRYNMNLDGQKVLDLTDFKVASEWGYSQGESSLLECQNIAEIALEKEYNVIKVQSYRDTGINYVIFNNFDEILQPQMVTPIGGMIMDNKKRKLNLIVAHAKCSNCGTERVLYFTSNNIYGERIVSTKSGKRCAYVNLFSENIVQELEKYCVELCQEYATNIPSNKVSQIVSSIYGITCDEISGEKIDTTPNTKCPNCLKRKLVEDENYGEQLTVVEADEVTHNSWEKLEVNERKEKVNGELHRQGFLE